MPHICLFPHSLHGCCLPKGVNETMEAKSDPRIKEAKKTGPMGVPHLAQMMTQAAPPTAPTTVPIVPAPDQHEKQSYFHN